MISAIDSEWTAEDEAVYQANNPWKEYHSMSGWDSMAPKDKATILNYKRQLLANIKVDSEMVKKVNEIHEKYPNFTVASIP